MKTLFNIITLASALVASAQQYGVGNTLASIGGTNATATASNVAGVATLTKYDQFSIEAVIALTNAAAGTLDVAWDTSNDNSSWATTGAGLGWFSIPLTNGGAVIKWNTNITINSVGYWRARWITNASGQSATSIVIRAYIKPRRNG
jgi:hypothetical protein